MDLIWGIGGALATGAAVFVAAPVALSVAGFTGAGIILSRSVYIQYLIFRTQ